MPKLECPEYLSLQRKYQEQGNFRVYQYWADNRENPHWRQWNLNIPFDSDDMANLSLSLFSSLESRKIRHSLEDDQLRWGKLDGGTYNLKEAKLYIEQRHLEEKM